MSLILLNSFYEEGTDSQNIYIVGTLSSHKQSLSITGSVEAVSGNVGDASLLTKKQSLNILGSLTYEGTGLFSSNKSTVSIAGTLVTATNGTIAIVSKKQVATLLGETEIIISGYANLNTKYSYTLGSGGLSFSGGLSQQERILYHCLVLRYSK